MIRRRRVRLCPAIFLWIAVFSPLHAQEEAEPFPPAASPIWREALEGTVTGIPSVQGETVVVVLDGGNLKAYTRWGTFLWDYFAGEKLCPYITRSPEGTSYVCTQSGTLIALNRMGRELWRIDLASPLSAPVLIGWDRRLFIPAGDRLFCYTASGYPLWGKILPAPMALAPVADKGGGFLTVLENGEFLAIDPFGNIRSLPLPSVPGAIISLAGGSRPGEPERVLVFYKTGAVDVVSRDPGGSQSIAAAAGLPSPALAAVSRRDLTALTLADGRVLLLSTGDPENAFKDDSGEDGNAEISILWIGESHFVTGKNPDDEAVSMLFDERGIYVLSRNGASAFTEDGRRLWTLKLEGASSIPAFSDGGVLFSGGEDWILYAYQTEERRRPRSGLSPEGDYGLGSPPLASWEDYSLGRGEIDPHLARIRTNVFAGRVGENERDYTGYLMALSGSFFRSPAVSAVRPPVHIYHRMEGARLLGYIGSRETIPFLAALLYYEGEALVKIAAVEAIGRIGLDPDAIALRVFSALLASGPSGKDERLLLAMAAATGSLCRFSGPLISGRGVKILVTLTGGEYPPEVRKAARQELDTLL